MKKINIIYRNFLVSFIMIGQAFAFFWFTAPEALALILHPTLERLTEAYTWIYIASACLLGWGLGLFSDTCKAYGQHRLWRQGKLTHY